MQLIIGNKNYSSWSLRPWIFMRTFKMDFEEVRIPLYNNEAVTRLSGYFSGGKVPVLVDGDRVIWDSLAILEYLSETYLAGKGWPDDPGLCQIYQCGNACQLPVTQIGITHELPEEFRKQVRLRGSSKGYRQDNVYLGKVQKRE